jgi:hypothetical protein
VDWPPFDLDINCRNSLPIATRVARIYGAEPLSLGTDGPAPIWTDIHGIDDALELTQDLVARLVGEELLDPQQIVVLADDRDFVDHLRQRLAADTMFVELGKAGVVAETVHRFKGLEADVVLCVVVARHTAVDVRLLAYVGLSRAKTMLFVLAPKELKAILNWK